MTEISVKSVEELISKHFSKHLNWQKVSRFLHNNKAKSVKELAEYIFNIFLEDVKFVAEADPSQRDNSSVLNNKSKAIVATMHYRCANFFYYCELSDEPEILKNICREVMENCAVKTLIDIHPAAKIGKQFFIDHGANTVIGATCEIGERCTIFHDVILGSKNVKANENVKRHPTLKNDVTVCGGARILGNITIGNNVFIAPHAVVLDDVEDNQQVLIVNQVQITKNMQYSYLPSQKLIVYGIVPKFKNSVYILGESFYNPTVLIKLKNNKELNYSVTYWDKYKIIVKFKNTTPLDKDTTKGAKLIILNNNNKVIVVNNIGLEKALTTLTN